MPRSSEQTSRSGWRDEWLASGIALVTVVAVLVIAGVHSLTQVLLASLTLLLLAGFVLARGRRGIRPVPFAGVALLALAATALQLLPLPALVVAWLSPHAYDVRLMITPNARFMPLTLDVPATCLALARGATCLGLLIVTDGLIRVHRHERRFLWLLVLVATGEALIAIAQRFVGAKQILGIYTPHSTPGFGFFGTFVDVNHCASLLALGTLIAAGLAIERHGRQRVALLLCAIVTGGALLFTTSRGGLFGFAVGGVLLTLILTARVVGFLRAAVTALVVLLIGASFTLWVHEGLRARTVAAPAQMWNNQKVRGWADGLRMANDYRWTGVGRGAFESPVNAYRANDESVRLVYPEDLGVQLVSEWGFPLALALLLLGFLRAGRLTPAIFKLPPGSVAAACAVVAVVTHDLVDFGLEMPGVAFPTVVALGVVTGGVAVDQRRSMPKRGWRLSPRLAWPLVAALALFMIPAARGSRHTLDLDCAWLRKGDDDGALQAAMARHPADDYLALVAAQRAMRAARPESGAEAMRQLNRALTLRPYNWQAHHMAARLLAASQRPAQAALEYRLAHESGMPLDVNELVRALGSHVVDAVPPTTPALLGLAQALYGGGRPVVGDAAAARAVELADAREQVLAERAQLAINFNAPAQAKAAAKALLAEAEAPESFVLAARACASGGDRPAANAAIDAGLKRHPHEALLFLSGARLRYEANDFAGAHALLSRAGRVATLTLEDRLHAEELLADVAEREGDTATAMVARARSKMIAQRIRDMSFSERK
jgi:hypothetical protein